MAARVKNPAVDRQAALREYVKKHWGDAGDFDEESAVVVDPRHGALVVLGFFESIVYSTRKAFGPITNYEHEFCEGKRDGEGRPKKGHDLPLVCFHVCDDKKCTSRGKLVVVGGTYRVTDDGIVG